MTVKNQILVTMYSTKTVLVMELFDHKLQFISAYNIDEDPLGTVYLGRIDKKLSNIGSSFVMYQKGKTGFIKTDNNKSSDILPVMKKSAASGDKKDVFTDEIEVSDEYAVIKKGNGVISVSKKADRKLRTELIETFSDIAKSLDIDILIRTRGTQCGKEELIEKIMRLKTDLDEIFVKASTRTVYSTLHMPPGEYIKDVFALVKSDDAVIITDDSSRYNELCDFYNSDACDKKCEIQLYDDKQVSLNTLYAVKSKLSDVLSVKVNLKSGATLFIEATTALTAIDVNTASAFLGKDKEAAFLAINLEAAKEAVRQIILRNISGIIIIDFINMKSKESYDILQAEVLNLLETDKVMSRLCSITSLGLFEISRKRVQLSLREQINSSKGERII